MKRVFFLVVAIMLMLSATAFAERGVIVFCNERSGVIIIGTNMGYTCGTSSYIIPIGVEQGNQVGGEFSSYGSHEIYDLTANTTFQLWIDEYWVSRDQAIAWLQRQ